MPINSFAEAAPEKLALIMAGASEGLSYAELDDGSARLAHLFLASGLVSGDRVAALLSNEPEFLTVAWGVRRGGLRLVPINWHLTASEAAYIVEDSDAAALVASGSLVALARDIDGECSLKLRLTTGPSVQGFENLGAASSRFPTGQPLDAIDGSMMYYSSGTTGRPKGILRPQDDTPFGEPRPVERLFASHFGFDTETVYLCPAPLYHAAPLGWSMTVQAAGGCVVLMDRFDAEAALAAIERHRVTHAQFVPTHFVRMLKLPEEVRARYDLSSLKIAIHAAAPCPPDVKQRMIAWLGPIVHEYYSGSEGAGLTMISPEEWLAKPGSVGRSITGKIHILDENNAELPSGQAGTIYFEGAEPISYHKAPEKTGQMFNDRGWGTLGDIGWLDGEGYLFLTDRLSNMIISGGVNIYPQEIENLLALHPAVADVAAIGIPDPDFGETVQLVIQPASGHPPDPVLAEELLQHCRLHLARYKCPKSVVFIEQMPRLPNGKLLKRLLNAPGQHSTTINTTQESTPSE